jgi:altronate dehydratase
MGTKCGGTEKTSREVCHPVLGEACDILVDNGATVVLTETYEMAYVAEDLLDAVEWILAREGVEPNP